MSTKREAMRWTMVVFLGTLLGLTFSFLGTVFYHPKGEEKDAREAAPAASRERRNFAPAKLSEDGMRQELIGVIESQLTAFRKDDYPKAYHYAAANVRDELPLPAFERMVRQNYPVIARSNRAEFGVIVDNGDEAVVDVVVSGPGRAAEYEYLLTREVTGWKICGVIRKAATGQVI